jgi:hypothetical protein
MRTALELIQVVERAGARFQFDGDRLGVAPARVVQHVLEDLRQHKTEIVELLQSGSNPDPERTERMPTMPPGVRLIRWEPKARPVQLSRCSTVTDVDKFIRSTLRQVEARLHGKSWLAGGWTLSTLLERLEVCGCFVKLDNPRQAVQ